MLKDAVRLGAVEALFCENEEGIPSLVLVPSGMQGDVRPDKLESCSAMVQVHVRGAGHRVPYTKGMTMLGSNTAASMRMVALQKSENGVKATLAAANELRFEQELTPVGRALRCRTAIVNASNTFLMLDHAATFCIAGMTPFESGPAPDCMRVHRFSSYWSCEGRHQSQTLEELNMEVSWSRWAPKHVKIGQAGTMPVRDWFPLMALEDEKRMVTWAASVAWAGSWSMELFRQKEDLMLCGGLAGFEDGHFRKTLSPGETLQLPDAYLTVVRGGIDEACEALLDAHEANLEVRGKGEETLAPMYNEYCDTWGKPTRESVRAELNALRGLNLKYFVIDAGWYGKEKDWQVSTGDWRVRESAFPDGMSAIADEIRAEGMIPGIWFEAEVASCLSDVFREHPEMFVTENGQPVIETDRAFLNLTRADAQAYLQSRVIDFLRYNHFGYVKIDYNNTYGMGFDGFESLGEAQRNGILGTYRFFDEMRRQLPDLLVENCSSGGHRLEISMMSRCAMASFSDAHECTDIPLIAADLQRLILPRQSQIWAVIRKEDSLRRIIWSVSAGTLGRLCLSGHVAALSDAQMDAVRAGVDFYRRAAPIIAHGSTRVDRRGITAYDHAHGWQAVVRTGTDGILVTAHAFEQNGGEFIPDCDFSGYAVTALYADAGCGASLANGRLVLHVNGEYCGLAVLLTRK